MHVVLQLRPHNAGDFLQLGNAQYAEARSGGAESEEDTAEAGGAHRGVRHASGELRAPVLASMTSALASFRRGLALSPQDTNLS